MPPQQGQGRLIIYESIEPLVVPPLRTNPELTQIVNAWSWLTEGEKLQDQRIVRSTPSG